jgi:hypothetical protein
LHYTSFLTIILWLTTSRVIKGSQKNAKEKMHEQLYAQLIKADPADVAAGAQCQFSAEASQYTLKFLNTDYIVDIDQQCIIPAQDGAANPNYIQQLCILAYLINASDIPLSGKLVTADKLPGGQFFFRPPHELPNKQLEKAFGNDPASLIEAAVPLDPIECEYGDASISFLAFPNVPICFIVWKGDEEFPARASILFDSTADQQLPLDALWSATNTAAKIITK